MDNNRTSTIDELLRNADLRAELKPFDDEALWRVNTRHWTLGRENNYLSQMLAWEKAPVLPVAEWFDPPLAPPDPRTVSEEELPGLIDYLAKKLFEMQMVLDFTDHLPDSLLYALIVRRILPAQAKKILHSGVWTHWDCSLASDEDEYIQIWLTYYATEEERQEWQSTNGEPLPLKLVPLYPRQLPTEVATNHEEE